MATTESDTTSNTDAVCTNGVCPKGCEVCGFGGTLAALNSVDVQQDYNLVDAHATVDGTCTDIQDHDYSHGQMDNDVFTVGFCTIIIDMFMAYVQLMRAIVRCRGRRMPIRECRDYVCRRILGGRPRVERERKRKYI